MASLTIKFTLDVESIAILLRKKIVGLCLTTIKIENICVLRNLLFRFKDHT